MNTLQVFLYQRARKHSQAAWFVLCCCVHLAFLLALRVAEPIALYGSPVVLEVSMLAEGAAVPASLLTQPRSHTPIAERKPSPAALNNTLARPPTLPPVIAATVPSGTEPESTVPPASSTSNRLAAAEAKSNQVESAPSAKDGLSLDGRSAAATPAAAEKVLNASEVGFIEPPRPEYPPISRRNLEQGRVMLKVLIDATGAPVSLVVSQSSGFSRLDGAAIAGVSRALFKPHQENGKPISVWAYLPIIFSLKN